MIYSLLLYTHRSLLSWVSSYTREALYLKVYQGLAHLDAIPSP